MKTIKCTIWKIGNLYRITVNDIRYRNLNTACIFDIDILFEKINETITKEQDVTVVFETLDEEKCMMKR